METSHSFIFHVFLAWTFSPPSFLYISIGVQLRLLPQAPHPPAAARPTESAPTVAPMLMLWFSNRHVLLATHPVKLIANVSLLTWQPALLIVTFGTRPLISLVWWIAMHLEVVLVSELDVFRPLRLHQQQLLRLPVSHLQQHRRLPVSHLLQ
jgi:hypothetical protein